MILAHVYQLLTKYIEELRVAELRAGALTMALSNSQRENATLKARVLELEKLLSTDGCLCSDYENLSQKYRDLEKEYQDVAVYAPREED